MTNGDKDYVEEISMQFPLTSGGAFILDVHTGAPATVLVTAGHEIQVDVSVIKTVSGHQEQEARRIAAGLRMQNEYRGSDMVLTTTTDTEDKALRLSFPIALPASGNFKLQTKHGDVEISNVDGELRLSKVGQEQMGAGTPREEIRIEVGSRLDVQM